MDNLPNIKLMKGMLNQTIWNATFERAKDSFINFFRDSTWNANCYLNTNPNSSLIIIWLITVLTSSKHKHHLKHGYWTTPMCPQHNPTHQSIDKNINMLDRIAPTMSIDICAQNYRPRVLLKVSVKKAQEMFKSTFF